MLVPFPGCRGHLIPSMVAYILVRVPWKMAFGKELISNSFWNESRVEVLSKFEPMSQNHQSLLIFHQEAVKNAFKEGK